MFKIYSRFGIWIAVILIAYFLLLKIVGLHQYPVLSAANGLIYAIGLYMAMKTYRSRKTTRLKYEKGFEVGLFCGGIATILFTIFMAIYMYQIDGEFAANIMESWDLEYDLGTLMLLISLLIMGFATTLVLTLAFMQLLKNSWNTPDGNRNTMK
ncbi:DUF4199 domain-containing protein [Aequorivita echinoideorum]|uniref:DUF4199 family protein n=1 Tax=Aequorivita echinoideorum TaxID=1549647 RepID=A0ABS5S156_9FLAO|nr:DUF4199 domain-containing protein [Aequorivita echinoideorum]MBT0606941.1 DUF4199 family protein [Aequorivita echinoideorum]